MLLNTALVINILGMILVVISGFTMMVPIFNIGVIAICVAAILALVGAALEVM